MKKKSFMSFLTTFTSLTALLFSCKKNTTPPSSSSSTPSSISISSSTSTSPSTSSSSPSSSSPSSSSPSSTTSSSSVPSSSTSSSTTTTVTENFSSANFTYNVTDQQRKLVKIIEYKTYFNDERDNNITIPGTINGYTVTEIADSVFFNQTNLKTVQLEEGLEKIGSFAFSYCEQLQEITLPKSLLSLSEDVFNHCTSLKKVTIQGSVSTIPKSAFYFCTSLSDVTLANGLEKIDEGAFYNCSSLSSITIPESVTAIENYAFYNCFGLTEVNIPKNVNSIKERSFSSCTSLQSISVNQQNTVYLSSNNCLIERDSKTLVLGCKNSTIPATLVTKIGDYAFERCTGLTMLVIPTEVIFLGYNPFNLCKNLSLYYAGSEEQWKAVQQPENQPKVSIKGYNYQPSN